MLIFFIATTAILCLCLGCYLYFRIRKENKPAAPHPLLIYYSSFIEAALSECPGLKIVPAKNAVLFSSKDAQGQETLSLSKVQNKTIAVWTWTSPGFGERGKEWSFPYTYEQKLMYEEIKQARELYQASLYQKYNLSIPSRKNSLSPS